MPTRPNKAKPKPKATANLTRKRKSPASDSDSSPASGGSPASGSDSGGSPASGSGPAIDPPTLLSRLFDRIFAVNTAGTYTSIPDYVWHILPFRDACSSFPRNMWAGSIIHRKRCKADNAFFAGTVFAETIKSTARAAAAMATTDVQKAREMALASKLTPANVCRVLHSGAFFTCCDQYCSAEGAPIATTGVFCCRCWKDPRNNSRHAGSFVDFCKDFALIWHNVVRKDATLADLKS
jgi:hypothetical protein